MEDSKKRFANRVDDYKKYRPSYPYEALEFVKEQCTIDTGWTVADIGSGTGISTKAMLDVFQCNVYAVEPNENMRLEAEKGLAINPLFHSVQGSSEDSTLGNRSINLIAAFQAYHWFDKERTRAEFRRILKEPGWVLLVWNDRITHGTRFLQGYEEILKELPEYPKVNHKNTEKGDIERFIGASEVLYNDFPNSQRFDREGLKGRFFSSSYTPSIGSVEYQEQMKKMDTLFDTTNENGHIEFKYRTQIFLGRFE